MKPAESLYQLGVVPPFIIFYLLMSLNAVAIAKWKNEGNYLRPVRGLHSGLQTGFLLGLFLGVVSWIVMGFSGKSEAIPSGATLEALIICTGIGLSLGYIFGVIYGFKAEFRDYL
ncbi:hypothetical protein K8R30_04970 [archaeon]|nr:hypothetical protein [archaeon]